MDAPRASTASQERPVPPKAHQGLHVVLVEAGWKRPPEIEAMIVALGYSVQPLESLAMMPVRLRSAAAAAVVIENRSMGLKDLLVLQETRALWPSLPIVMVTTTCASPTDMRRALDHGATAFVSWPCAQGTFHAALTRSAGAPVDDEPRRARSRKENEPMSDSTLTDEVVTETAGVPTNEAETLARLSRVDEELRQAQQQAREAGRRLHEQRSRLAIRTARLQSEKDRLRAQEAVQGSERHTEEVNRLRQSVADSDDALTAEIRRFEGDLAVADRSRSEVTAQIERLKGVRSALLSQLPDEARSSYEQAQPPRQSRQ